MFIEPHRAVWDAFERIVDREYDRVGVDLGEGSSAGVEKWLEVVMKTCGPR